VGSDEDREDRKKEKKKDSEWKPFDEGVEVKRDAVDMDVDERKSAELEDITRFVLPKSGNVDEDGLLNEDGNFYGF
ncbi:unnamed protein product, partial [Amoebophrya sp. A25]